MPKADSSALFSGRLLFLTGKGGVGKTSVAAAVGKLAASQGRRTLVVEVDSQHPTLPGVFGKSVGYEPVEVDRNLWGANIVWANALEDWVESIVSMRRIVRLIMKNRVVSLFLQVTPGARDLVMLWRIGQLCNHYDLVVVDMPASGNAVAMLTVPHTAERLFPTGPIRRCAEEILALYARKDSSLALVAIPEEMVVNETLETFHKLRRDVRGLQIGALLLNRASMPSYTEAERQLLGKLEALHPAGVAAEVIGAGRWEEALERATGEALSRLAPVERPILALPSLPRNEGPKRVVAQICAALARVASSSVTFRGGVS